MAQTITAVYEHGVFRPLERVDLQERATVQLTWEPAEEDLSTRFHPAKMEEWARKYALSESVIELLSTEPEDSPLTLEDVLALNRCIGTGNAGEEFDIEELCFREDIWDAEY